MVSVCVCVRARASFCVSREAGLLGCVSNEMGCAVCAHEFVTRSGCCVVCVCSRRSSATALSVSHSSPPRTTPSYSTPVLHSHKHTHFSPLLPFLVNFFTNESKRVEVSQHENKRDIYNVPTHPIFLYPR